MMGSRAADQFNSNDTNILQRKLQDLQAELAMLDNEYESLEAENKQMHE
jgi:cell division protein FtsB